MRICILDHHTKAAYFGMKLAEAGFDLVAPDADFNFDLLLVDTDHPHSPPVPQKNLYIGAAIAKGVQVGIYPHGGMSVLDYDWGRQPMPLAFELVHGEGHAEVYRRIGLRRRVEVVGWSYSDVLPKAEGPVKSVVFAPIHPWANGKDILPIHRAANELAYRAFLEYPYGKKIVRCYGEDDPNGITERVEGIDYQQSDLRLGIDLIDSVDAVVSYGTFACTALARGKRVVMILPHPPHLSDDGKLQAKHFSDYAEYTRYPATVGDAPLQELFKVDTSGWEEKFIGGPLNVDHLAGVLRSYRPNRAQRRKRARA